MKIVGLIWLDDIVEKLYEKHHVTQEEVVRFLIVGLSFGASKRGIVQGKMFTLLPVKRQVDVI